MYDVMVYDEEVGQFVPAKDTRGKRIAFSSWSEASDAVYAFTLRNPQRMYKTQFRTVRRKKARR